MNNMNMNNLTKDMKNTAKKAKYMAKEVTEDVKDNMQGAMYMMESKAEEMVDMYEQKKFSAQIKNQMKKENK